ncbi:DUF2470 domain-containing protein [Streptomyces sp. GC420]|uniref:DUF2470 domain-containing protein n=1 Tax=Streptomyces sp. GC420 TaxID=2697568 RepID=UPI0014152378|nr:DUF2470 domain-containing protein [Streptomyces sp. GC420]NBM16521.1 DUF2470 domain-containing protein [Streptomyces sp. GC420]
MSRPGIPLSSAGPATDESAPGSPEPGQPRPMEGTRQPTGAERVRTLVESNTSVSLTLPSAEAEDVGWGVPVARTVTPDGDVILLVPGDSVAAGAAAHAQADDLPVVMDVTDVAPVSVPHRIRARAAVSGRLTAVRPEERALCAMLLARRHPVGGLLGVQEILGTGPAPGPSGRAAWVLLRLEVDGARVEDLWGAADVDAEEFAAAACDPLAGHEAELLQHLHSAHADQVRGLSVLLGEREADAEAAGGRAVPLALDRFGLRIRFGTGEDCFDARFEFPEPVRDVAGLRRAMHGLFEAAV